MQHSGTLCFLYCDKNMVATYLLTICNCVNVSYSCASIANLYILSSDKIRDVNPIITL